MPRIVNVWSEVASFELTLEELETVFLIGQEQGTISLNKSKSYADTIASALAKVIPGRFTLFGSPTLGKIKISFRFVKPCSLKSKCPKKWNVVCTKEAILNGRYEFIVHTNEIACEHTQEYPVPRPLSGKFIS